MMFSWFQASFNTLFNGNEMAQPVSQPQYPLAPYPPLSAWGTPSSPTRQAFSAMAIEDPAVRDAIQDATVEVAASQRDVVMGQRAS